MTGELQSLLLETEEDTDVSEFYKYFNCKDEDELNEKIKQVKDFNNNTIGRTIIYPTKDLEELESLYLKFMSIDDKEESDSKAIELFGRSNRNIYDFVKYHIVEKDGYTVDKHTIDDEEVEDKIKSSSIFSNDLPMFTPKEYFEKIDEDYSCFIDDEDVNVIKEWASLYSLLGQGIKTENYNEKNLQRINILRKAIYENSHDAIIKCGWIPGVEFNSENRVKASQIVREKMEAMTANNIYTADDLINNRLKFEDWIDNSDETIEDVFNRNESYIEENMILNKKDLEINLDKFKNGKTNVLLVTGFSGSGKSTLAKQLASKYKCSHYELDCLDFYLGKNMSLEDAIGNEDGLVAFIKKKKLEPGKKLNNDEAKELYREYIKFLISWCKKQDGKFIIEGLQIYEVYEDGDTFITSCPMVIKGTSGLISAIRAAKRNNSENKDSTFLKEFKPLIAWVSKDLKALNKLKKDINESYIEEASNNKDKKAVSIVFVAGTSMLAKTIRKVQGTQFSHASISLDDDLSRIYSYNMRDGFNGFTYESIKGYIEDGVQKMGVYTFLVSDKVYKKLEKTLDKFNLYIDKTKYSVLNLLTIPANIPLDMDMRMVCSQFVDNLLKAADLDLTNKKSSLVGPKDLIAVAGTKSNIVEVFNGNPKKFKPKEIAKKIKKLKNSNLPIYEFVEYDEKQILESLETKLRYPTLPKYVNIYHGATSNKYKMIEPRSYNPGTKLTNPRMSSFWMIDIEGAKAFAVAELIDKNSIDDFDMIIDKDGKALVPKKFKDNIINILKNNKCYVYEKSNIESKYLGIGHGKNFKEYTFDLPIKPDKIHTVSYPENLNYVTFESDQYIEKIRKYWKDNKFSFMYHSYNTKKTDKQYIKSLTEAKSFPVQFDNDGNLILKNLRRINFEQEYANSHRLLMEYDRSNSYDPMKFELAKMQFFITLLEKKIYKQGKDKSMKELKVRARFLNDFKKYLKIVTSNDPNFNFTEYYEQSPFNDALIKIDNSTLKFGWEALKYMLK